MSKSQREISSNIAGNDSWYNDFADKLLSENFLLTALEFYAEVIETGKELPKLKDFFSNPGNFEQQLSNKEESVQSDNIPRSSSQATLDSLDLTRYSEDGERSIDDRVAVLEFELRKAKDTISALRANLTEAAELATSKKIPEENLREAEVSICPQSLSIKPHEQRALNFLINEYLLLHGYKLTSITFSDENENQDFDDWNDVGLNSARPVELLYLYREGLKGIRNAAIVETRDFECQVKLFDEIKQNLQISELEAEIVQLSNKMQLMSVEYSRKINKLENQRTVEVDSQRSYTPDAENFEMIDVVKSNDEFESKSDKSNGEWTKIGEKFKKDSIDLKSDTQSNFESISNEEKVENPSGVFENEGNMTEKLQQENIDDRDVENINNENISENDSSVDIPKENSCENVFPYTDSSTLIGKPSNEILDIMNVGRYIPERFKREALKSCDMFIPIYSSESIFGQWFTEKIINDFTKQYIIEILSSSLPKIIPNILLNKREEIIPMLVLSICLNPDLSVRDKLLQLLFNLKKKPQDNERSIILQGLLKIAQLKGPSTVENEILPQCWEQITHKYAERRMLAAESCFALAPYVSEAIRNSLIISIAQQLLQDRDENIRKASINVIILLMTLVSGENKYDQILDICLKVLNDGSPEVISVATNVLFPTLAQWSFLLNKVQSDLYGKLLSKLKCENNLHVIHVIEILLPYLIISIAKSDFVKEVTSYTYSQSLTRQEFFHLCKGLCDPSLFYNESVEKLMEKFDFYTSQPDFDITNHPELEWIKNVFITGLLEAGNSFWEDSNTLKALTSTLRFLCLGLGKNITIFVIKPFLLEKLMECENAVVSGQNYKCAIIPLYLVGVLSTFLEELQEMSNTLRRFICALPLCGVSLSPLKITVEILSQYQPWRILILDSIWEGVAHQRPLVRCGSASLLQQVIPFTPEILINSKIVPALVTLTSDPEPSVRINAIPPLGMLINSKEKATREKVTMTFQTLLQESLSMENHSLLIQSVKTLGSVYECCDVKFIEEVIVPQLCAIAHLTTKTRIKDLIEVLTETFSIVTYSPIPLSSQCTSSSLLPGLRTLYNFCFLLNLQCSDRVDSMIKEVERRLHTSKDISSKSSMKSPSDVKKFATSVSTHVVVEDVRNRVNKIFNSKQNVSGIFKKKM